MKTNNVKRVVLTLLLAVLTTTAWALEQDPDDGYYLISSAQDWQDFATGISDGTIATNANARLTADNITVSSMIGTENRNYAGTFEGNNYNIISAINATGRYVAPFSYVNGATIQNLTISGSVNGGIHCSGLIGCSNGTNTVSNVTINASITTSDSHCGGFIGHGFSSNVTFTNCVFAGEIHGRSANSLVGVFNGWSGYNVSLNNCLEKGTYTNCNPFYPLGYISTATNTYYLTPPSSGESKGTRAYSTMPEGEVCGQVLVVDGNNYYVSTVISGINDRYELLGASVTPEPIVTFLGNTLAENTDYTLSYNNNTSGGTGSVTITGIGSYSGAKTIEFQIAATTLSGSGTEESPFIINSDADWTSFATSVNSGYTYTGLFVKMTNSVNAASMAGQREGEPFSGTFDGDGYTLTLAIVNSGSSTDINNPATGTAPFHYIKNATIKNVKTAGTVSATSIHTSGLVGMADGTNTIQGCTVSATINTTSNYVGGILAHGITSNTTIRDCVFDGAINGRSGGSSYLCGIYGWCHGGSVVITNCIEKGTFTNVGSGFNPVLINSYGVNCNVSNTYYYQPNNNGGNYGTQVYATIPDGEMCGKVTAVDGLQHYVVTTVSGINDRYVLTGASVEPVPTVKFFNTTLVNGTDYTVTYNNNTSGGTGSVIITGTETAYWGVKTVNFIIAANTLPGEGTVESPYTISDTNDWVEFVNSVHNGFSYSGKIVQLTANINITSSVGLREDFPFSGTFDGAGHTLTANISANGANTSGNVEGVAPFHFIKNATIKNLKIAGTITSTSNHTAGLVGFASGTNTIQSCVVSATLNVSANYVGGFIGHGQSSSITITDCLFDGNIARQTNSSNPAASFWGWSGSYANISNCLENGTYTNCSNFDAYGWVPSNRVLNNIYRKSNGNTGTLATAEELSDGTTTAALQNNRPETIWVQDLETNQPILKIFAIPGLQQDNEGYYLLGSMQNWKDFATLVETTPTANARMTADIDLGDDQTMIGTEAIKYQGTFDGQGHTLTIAYNVSVDRAAPFFYINNATIRNLHTAGSLTTTGQCGSGVVGAAHGTCSIECCHSSVAINATSSSRGDSYGGFVGLRASGGNLTISDCLFDGSITTTKKQHNGGFVGYSESGTTTAENCLLTATFDCGTDYSCTFLRYTGTITNSYYLNSLGTLQGTQTNTEELANGRVAYLLQTGRTDMFWGQEIGVDDQPVPTNDESKRVYLQRDGTYANTPDDGTLTQDADGYYLIGTVVDWQDFAAVVNGGTINTNARMTADIVLGVDQTMVGTASSPFHGTFDGQGHTLTVAYHQSTPAIAPFHFVGGGATIQNLHVDGCITNADNAAGGIAGQILGNLTIRNCWSSVVLQTRNTGNVQGTIGGICSFCEAESCAILIEDCIFTGTIVNTENAGGFMSHVRQASSSVTMRRCLNAGTYSADERQTGTFIRVLPNVTFGALNLETATLFYKNRLGVVQGTQATDETLADGTITTALQNGREEEVWVQDPVTNQPMLALFANTISFNGDGSEDNPFIITTTAELDYLASMVNSGENYDGMYFKLGADIAYDPNVLTIDNNGDGVNDSNFIPIGTGVFYYYNTPILCSFRGIFDGDGHTISGIRIYRVGNTSDDCYQGVFGFIQDFGPEDSFYAGIYNLWVADVDITGWINIGGIVGENFSSIIENCHVASNVYIHANNQDDVRRLGGIVGYNETHGTVTRCSSAVTIIPSNNNSYYDFGGLAGYNEGTLTNNLVIGATIPAVNHPYHNNFYGAIAGSRKLNYSSLQHNYYSACTVGGVPNATNVGCGPLISENNGVCSDLYDNNGAVPGNVRTVAAPNVWISEDPENESIDGWAFIASPLTDDTDPESTSVENIFSATDYDLYRLNPSNTKWENWKVGDGNNAASGFSLENGRGYLYATQETDTIKFNGEADEFNLSDTTEVALSQGFNLVGNPFPRAAYINKPYYTLNADGSAVSTSTSTAYIPPCYGVVVDANEGETVTFTTTAPAQQNAVNNGNLQIAVSQVPELVEGPARDKGGVSTGSTTATLDNAIVSFNEGERLGKFYFGSQNANIYLPQNGKDYAIAYSDRAGEMPVNFKAKENGQYTITVKPEGVEMSYLHLIDNMTGADVDLLALRPFDGPQGPQAQGPASYTFFAKTTDYASRFKLVFVTNNEDGPSTGSGAFAFIDASGNIIITEDVSDAMLQVIDAMGRVLVCRDAPRASAIATAGMTPGVYVLRLINGDNVKTQKIIIK